MGGIYGKWGEVHAGFWSGNLSEIDHLICPSIQGMIILKLICKNWDWAMDCFDMYRDRDKWRNEPSGSKK